MLIAGNARIWRTAIQILAGKIIDHVRLEFLLKIKNIMRNPQFPRYAPRIFNADDAAAGLRIFLGAPAPTIILIVLFADPSAAEHALAVIKNAGLPRSNRVLRFIENNLRLIAG